MSIKLAVFDLDHTLLLTGSRIAPEAAAGVAALVADGLDVALASARLDPSMQIVNDAIGVPLTRISYNGALTTLADGTVVHEVGFQITPELAGVLADFTAPTHDGWGAIDVYTSDDRWLAYGNPEGIAREERDTWCTADQHGDQPNPEELVGLRCRKIMCEGPAALIPALEEAVGRIDGLNLTHSGMELHDIWPSDSGKGNALAALCRHLGLGPHEVIACGDSATDVPMLQWAGTSIGVQPCAPAVTEVATHLVTGAGGPELFAAVRRLAGLPPRP
ncbi:MULTISPECIES: HAD family hydrolase [unclassified Luteococcus]|uniref:HAD family hydrolase n=1 Tax=unclassified Luteococcus TaxID=2639923 RepID=UPI00313AF159